VAALSLFEALALTGADVAKERPDMFDVVLQRAHDRNDRSLLDAEQDPLLVAINRPSMKALQTAIILGWRSIRAGGPVPPALVDLLDEVVAVDGADGLQSQAILARSLDELGEAVPDWMTSHHDQLFGQAAPDDLGQRTVELAVSRRGIKFGMLETLRDQVFRAAAAKVRNSRSYLLMAMLNGVRDFSVDEVGEWLIARDAASIGDVVGTLGHLLTREQDTDALERGIKLVDVLTARGATPETMAGLGRWYGVRALDDTR